MAQNGRMSVSAIVNRSLRHFVEWDRFAEFFGLMTFTPMLVEEMVDRLSPDEARAKGRKNAVELAKPMIMLMTGEFNTDHALEALRMFGPGTRAFKFEDRAEGGKHVMVIRHAMGKNWSAYYQGMLAGIFEDGLHVPLKTSTTQRTCVASFED
jgi:hypothetical protein